MLEVSNVAVPLEGGLPSGEQIIRQAVADKLNIPESCIASVRVVKKSVDARKKSDVHFVMTLTVALASENQEMALIYAQGALSDGALNASAFRNPSFTYAANGKGDVKVDIPAAKLVVPRVAKSLLPDDYVRPVVVGTGPAGLFAALYLARSGLRPLVIERGGCVEQRVRAVEHFNETGALDPVTNIQFGEGGAGTFSDGKLTTNTKNPLTRTVLEWFVQAGAPEDILIEAKPHIGTDKLRAVVKKLREQIEACGGQVLFNTQLVDLQFSEGALSGITVENTFERTRSTFAASALVLACGHSARDTFALLRDKDFLLQRKAFSVGVRIEHPQSMIDQAQYGACAAHPALGAADYKLSAHLPNGRGVYTFCMCPGGQVVAAASEAGGVVVNGMSVHARDGENANSAVLVGVEPADFPGDDPLAGIDFQRDLEQAAYQLAQENGGAPYAAPAQRVGDFLAGTRAAGASRAQAADAQAAGMRATTRGQRHSKKKGKGKAAQCAPVAPTYARGVAWSDLHECLPPFVTESLEQALVRFDAKLHGFAADNAVMTAVETRSSSPVRVVRHPETLQAFFADEAPAAGVYPCGEGAGYAGGIMSAAVDGLRVAQQVARVLSPIDLRCYLREGEGGAAPQSAGAERAGLRSEASERNPISSSERSTGRQVTYSSNERREKMTPAASFVVPVAGEERTYVDEAGARFTYVPLTNGTMRLLSCENATDQVLCAAYLEGKLVSEIDSRALLGVKNVRVLRLPAGVQRAQAGLLRHLVHVESLILPDAMAMLDTALLSPLRTVGTLQLPSMLTRIPVGLFRGCTLRELRIGAGTREVAQGAFAASTLERVEIDPENHWLYTDGQGIYRKSDNALLALATSVEQYRVLDGCTRICHKAFANMAQVASVELPDSLETIESFAFFRAGLCALQTPPGLRVIERKAFAQCANLERVQLNEGLVSLGEEAFSDTPLRSLELPASVRQLGARFCGMPRLDDCVQGHLVPRVSVSPDNKTFFIDEQQGLYQYGKAEAEDVRAPRLIFKELLNASAQEYALDERTVAIGPAAFARQTRLAVVELPAGLEVIGNRAFLSCSSLGCVEGSEKLRVIEDGAFIGTALQSLHLPAAMERMGRSALLLREGTGFAPPRMIARLSVDPRCATFFFDDDFLCQRLPDGGVAALLYCGHAACVRIPAAVTEVRAYCLVNANKVTSVETHDGVLLYETDCFLTNDVLRSVVVDLKNHPIEGHSRIVLSYPDNSTGRDALRQSFASQSFLVAAKFGLSQPLRAALQKPAGGTGGAPAPVPAAPGAASAPAPAPSAAPSAAAPAPASALGGSQPMASQEPPTGWDAKNALSRSDEAMYWCPNTLRMTAYALNRLYDPLYLSAEARDRFEPVIARRLPEIVKLFAQNNYLHGFDQLFSLGFITKQNVVEMIDVAGEVNAVEATGHLFELRRRFFGYDVMSEFDL